jgi:DNA-binding beta-propeller fold protein YncE
LHIVFFHSRSQGFILKHNFLKQLNINTQNVYCISTIVPKHKFNLELVLKNVYLSNNKNFHKNRSNGRQLLSQNKGQDNINNMPEVPLIYVYINNICDILILFYYLFINILVE